MNNIINTNKGMYAEEIVNRTISYYLQSNVGLIEKRNIPFKIIRAMENNMFVGKLLDKSLVDYTGFINDKHVEFEVKETSDDKFALNKIKPHQLDYLLRCLKTKILAFVIIYFHKHEQFFVLPISWIAKHLEQKNKTIPYQEIKNNCLSLPIIYPGIIDLEQAINVISK
ncbi:MAG: Holliday junction resolvase RecU [Mycoplasmataceae bacterium]|nr:Holliday junction resolvase RecU [Mycoplasmataceae bacterium]